jgi:glycosyltransferase involved in cell wall biosynthesis
VVLRVGGQARWRVEVHGEEGALVAAQTDHEPTLRRLLEPLRRRRVRYACGVSDPDPVTIPALLLSLANEAEEPTLEVELHDYFPVSPSYTLLDARGRFAGPVVAGGAASRDPAHGALRPDGSRVGLDEWQAAWAPLLARAEVTAFSQASLDLLLAAYPEASPRARVVPHAPLADVTPVPRPPGPRVLGVLGNIAPHKGAALLQGIARRLPSRAGIARLALLGDMDPAFALPRSVRVHGPYEPGDIAGLAQRYGITDWLIPSIWPETFSFTTREALATGLPVFAFAIGAQGEAVAAAPNGRPLPFHLASDPAATLAAIEAAA